MKANGAQHTPARRATPLGRGDFVCWNRTRAARWDPDKSGQANAPYLYEPYLYE